MAHTNLRLLSRELQLFFSWCIMIIIMNWKANFSHHKNQTGSFDGGFFPFSKGDKLPGFRSNYVPSG